MNPLATETVLDDGQELGRLRWRCRRGMRELDELLARYLERHYAMADSGQRCAFRSILELPDPELFGYLVGREAAQDEAQRDIIARIRTSN